MKTTFNSQSAIKLLEIAAKLIAGIIGVGIIIASIMIIISAFQDLFWIGPSKSIQDGLFVLILLEMFYVTLSFIKFSTINVGLIVNVGIIAAVKEMIFKLESMTLQGAIAFTVLFLSLGFLYFMESIHHQNKHTAAEHLETL